MPSRLRNHRRTVRHASNGHAANGNGHVAGGAARRNLRARPSRNRLAIRKLPDRIEQVRSAQAMRKDLAYLSQQIAAGKTAAAFRRSFKDRLSRHGPRFVLASSPLVNSRANGVERAQAALGQEWHAVKPVLRLMEVADGGTTSAVETKLRDIEIHGGVNNWYIDVQDPPTRASALISVRHRRRPLLQPGPQQTSSPRREPATKTTSIKTGPDIATDFERIYAQSGGYNGDGNGSVELQEVFEERLRRPMGSSLISRFGPASMVARRQEAVPLRDRRRVDRLRARPIPTPRSPCKTSRLSSAPTAPSRCATACRTPDK